MYITRNNDKLNRIVEIWYAALNAVSMVDYPGNFARCVGTFTQLKISEATFEESEPENGSPVEQQLDITVRGQNEDSDNESINICGQYLIMKLVFNNEKIKIVGTPDNPVVLSNSTTGEIIETKLYVKRYSAEKAKYLII